MLTNNAFCFRHAIQCAALIGITFSVPSFAESTSAEPQVVVKYAETDLNSEPGVAVFYSRLQSASRGVCRSLKGRDLASLQTYQDCYSKALADAVNAVNKQTLTALHNSPEARSVRVATRSKSDKQS
jgi:UrcA family protein